MSGRLSGSRLKLKAMIFSGGEKVILFGPNDTELTHLMTYDGDELILRRANGVEVFLAIGGQPSISSRQAPPPETSSSETGGSDISP